MLTRTWKMIRRNKDKPLRYSIGIKIEDEKKAIEELTRINNRLHLQAIKDLLR